MILCPELLAPANGTIVFSTASQLFGVGTTATYSCDTDYVLVGEITRICQDTNVGTTGTWSGPGYDPTCNLLRNDFGNTHHFIACV